MLTTADTVVNIIDHWRLKSAHKECTIPLCGARSAGNEEVR